MKQIEQYLGQYQKVFLARPKNEEEHQLFEAFLRYLDRNADEEHIVCLVEENMRERNLFCKDISEQDMNQLIKLYDTYDFSDRFHILFHDENHGSLKNYVDTEILTEEEVFQVLLK